ncbi:MAG: FMN-binding protein [Eubacteriales bacterium]|nr:FMN-binding protein [Eubacteriales bacterium]
MKKYLKPFLALVIACALLLVCSAGLSGVKEKRLENYRSSVFESMFPEGGDFEEIPYDGEDRNIQAVYRNKDGFIIETKVHGYGSFITSWIAVSRNGSVKDLKIVDMNETPTLGRRALTSSFISQFRGTEGGLTVGKNADALSGATITSRSIVKAINSACEYVIGCDAETGATKEGEEE